VKLVELFGQLFPRRPYFLTGSVSKYCRARRDLWQRHIVHFMGYTNQDGTNEERLSKEFIEQIILFS